MVKLIVKLAVLAVSDPKVRKTIAAVLIAVLLILLLIPTAIGILLFGSFGAVTGKATAESAIENEWSLVIEALEKGIADADDISEDIQELIVDYAPSYEYDISKAVIEDVISEKQDDILLVYTTDELEKAMLIQDEITEALLCVTTQADLDILTDGSNSEGFRLYDLKSDNKFYMNNMKLTDCTSAVRKLVYDLVKFRMPSYSYNEGTGYDRYGRPTKTQRLILTENGTYRMLVYTITGDGVIDLPSFLAVYYASNGISVKENYTAAVKEAIETFAVGAESLDSYENLKQKISDAQLEVLVAKPLRRAIRDLLNDGAISVTADTKYYLTGERYYIDVVFPTGDEWNSLFTVSQSNQALITENEEAIAQLLRLAEADAALTLDVSEYIDLDCIRYSEGLFAFPIDEKYLGEEPILSSMGDYREYHMFDGDIATEQGVTLSLSKADVPVVFALSEVGARIIGDVYIYNVENDESTYNCPTVTVAAVISIDNYEKEYGTFPFSDGDESEVTLLIEFGCLSSTHISESDIGKKLSYVVGNNGIIGYSHKGELSSTDELVYHVSITSTIDESDMQINPLFWFNYG